MANNCCRSNNRASMAKSIYSTNTTEWNCIIGSGFNDCTIEFAWFPAGSKKNIFITVGAFCNFLFSASRQQGYAYPANGYVQTTGLQFDPNYSRTASTYSSPTIQRYEFQAQQITPINQVSLQSVSFAPNVTYSQIASPTVLLNHQQHHPHYVSHQHQSDQLGNKQMTMSATLTTTASGNETPGK